MIIIMFITVNIYVYTVTVVLPFCQYTTVNSRTCLSNIAKEITLPENAKLIKVIQNT